MVQLVDLARFVSF
ncbi:hypothetical protein KBS49_000330 [Escherichia coli]|nr:hypothetical protein [Escherichia coli]